MNFEGMKISSKTNSNPEPCHSNKSSREVLVTAVAVLFKTLFAGLTICSLIKCIISETLVVCIN